MINNFKTAFEYVNSRYIYNDKNYPAMANMTTEQEKTIFALKHGLLHIFKHRDKLQCGDAWKDLKRNTRHYNLLALPDKQLPFSYIAYKKTLLKTVINILSICNTAGISQHNLSNMKIPSDKQMRKMVSASKNKIPTLGQCLNRFVEEMAIVLEKADHTNKINLDKVVDLAVDLYICVAYGLRDDTWVPKFLAQIPNVMKSK